MSQTQQQQGTTLEVLAPYLPYGIEVKFFDAPENYKVVGWKGASLYTTCPGKYDLEKPTGTFSECLPILRPFSSLTEPLPDGTVPAVEVAKIVGGTHIQWKVLYANADSISLIGDSYYRCTIRHIINPKSWAYNVSVYGFDQKQELMNAGKVIDYLRSQHFALPVNGRPLIEGVDYIAKKAAVVPTKEEGDRPS